MLSMTIIGKHFLYLLTTYTLHQLILYIFMESKEESIHLFSLCIESHIRLVSQFIIIFHCNVEPATLVPLATGCKQVFLVYLRQKFLFCISQSLLAYNYTSC